MANNSKNNSIDKECKEPLIIATNEGLVAVRMLCTLTVVVCAWALINTTRYSRRFNVTTSLSVGQIMLVHIFSAVFSIIGLSMVEGKIDQPFNKDISAEAIYVWLLIFNWQEHMLYLLLAVINASGAIRYDHAILYSVASWGSSSSPCMGAVLPRFSKKRVCGINLWRPDSSTLNRLYIMIPSTLVLTVMCVLFFYELGEWDRRSRRTHPTCPSCLECRKEHRAVKSRQLIRRLVLVFLLASLPRLVYWGLAYNSIYFTGDYEWLSLSAQGMSGALSGVIVLHMQWTLVACHVFPCYAGAAAQPESTDGGDQQQKAGGGDTRGSGTTSKGDGSAAEPARQPEHSRGRGELLAARAPWRCQCAHCTDHRNAAENKAAETVAAHAAALFVATTASGGSISRKSSVSRGSFKTSRETLRVKSIQFGRQHPPQTSSKITEKTD